MPSGGLTLLSAMLCYARAVYHDRGQAMHRARESKMRSSSYSSPRRSIGYRPTTSVFLLSSLLFFVPHCRCCRSLRPLPYHPPATRHACEATVMLMMTMTMIVAGLNPTDARAGMTQCRMQASPFHVNLPLNCCALSESLPLLLLLLFLLSILHTYTA
jgi:hypothetical protein